ncbi:GNAT family N-acetyltransferase [Streptomyces sp. ISL-36]|uniref:GNAT family N-acetyltransferase n=1 Tax=Streptomyces sp. ISL-36 TaxID=2819182 RepID=UPI001BEC4122|nr:GNAT family N-acetyltransferase [Streptomyces sp. ISL-36]MBT2444264.1 GNAT family N-acetyltransferase [Streptomyces sp. ISL-36]
MSDLTAVPLLTDRIDLVPLRLDHADEMATVLADPGLHTFIGGVPASGPALRERYARMLAGSPEPGVSWCNWVLRLRAEDCLAGTVQATVSDAGPGGRAAEVAWVVGTAWQGRGLASEAAVALVHWLRSRDVRTVLAHIHPDHHASARVAAAAGLAPTNLRQDGEIRWELTAADA